MPSLKSFKISKVSGSLLPLPTHYPSSRTPQLQTNGRRRKLREKCRIGMHSRMIAGVDSKSHLVPDPAFWHT